ncbi:MAG: DEAD/DEAH box helicase family protein [Candidatus Syntrophosphaera sp.]|nr:DEAD/DEAH box helicase family protein [Candidatus Syntrophosphaera sp.]
MDSQNTPPLRNSLNFVAIDIETTGLDFATSEIIELAAIRFRAGKASESFSTLVRPHKGMPKFIEFLTHISPEDLNGAPELKTALKGFFEFVGDDVLVGHNISFDTGFINHHSALSGSPVLERPAWDTAEISRVYFPYTSDHKLGTLVKHFGLELENAHRAAADATATGQLLVAMSEFILGHYPLLVNARLLDLSKQAQLANTLYHYLHGIVEYQRRYALIGKKPQPPDVAKPNVIEHQVPGVATVNIDKVFTADGLLSELFPNFEFRSGQLEMAREVDSCFRASKHLAVEAGTGVGKSFAYLVPAIAFSNQKKTKVVVSTNTKNLQEQLFYKDLPQLKEMLPLPFKATLVKGRENYVCERRWEEFLMEQTRGISPYEAQALLYLFIWKYLTKSGDVSENSSFDRNRFSIAWRKICSDRYMCMGRKCPHAGKCYVMSLRKHIENSSVVITNHSLLLADLQMENTTLGEYSYLVVDEAHNLTATATRNLGFELSFADLNNLFNQLSYSYRKKNTGFLHQLETTISKSIVTQGGKDHASLICKNLSEQVAALRKIILDLFTEASQRCQDADSYGKLRIKSPEDLPRLYTLIGALATAWKEFQKQLQALANVFSSFNSKQVPNYDNLTETLNSYVMRCLETENSILNVENPDLENYALWIENSYRTDSKNPSSSLCYAPVDVSTHLNKMLYEVVPSIVFTSATLALRGSFKYFFGQSGLSLVPPEHIATAIVDSPFDYDTQSRLMVGSFLPEHKDRFFINQALGCVEQLITTTNVGTMILFTSYRDLNSVYDHLSETLYHSKRPFFAQGKASSRSSMLEEFKRNKNAVLLGTNSFWEGVDIQGDSLSLLILFKLPFQVPSEPVVEALIDKLDRENKDSFMHFMLPNALLKLRQGFGRLIRSKTDRGIVLIMDSRVSNKRYGEYFKQVLPAKCLEMKSELELLSEVSRFFNMS